MKWVMGGIITTLLVVVMLFVRGEFIIGGEWFVAPMILALQSLIKSVMIEWYWICREREDDIKPRVITFYEFYDTEEENGSQSN